MCTGHLNAFNFCLYPIYWKMMLMNQIDLTTYPCILHFFDRIYFPLLQYNLHIGSPIFSPQSIQNLKRANVDLQKIHPFLTEVTGPRMKCPAHVITLEAAKVIVSQLCVLLIRHAGLQMNTTKRSKQTHAYTPSFFLNHIVCMGGSS